MTHTTIRQNLARCTEQQLQAYKATQAAWGAFVTARGQLSDLCPDYPDEYYADPHGYERAHAEEIATLYAQNSICSSFNYLD